jgi:hypothetical protein
MTTDEIIEQLQNKLSQIEKIIGLSSMHQVRIECLWTDVLQELVTYGNTTILKNFRYRLVMEHG